MNCPDWSALVAARDAGPPADLPAWMAARRHLADCGSCRGEALAADPLLIFDRLPERTVSPNEIASMQAAVASLVRAGRVAQAPPGSGHGAATVGFRSVSRFAAALGACFLLALSGAPRPHAPPPELDRSAAAGSFVPGQQVAGEGGAPMQSAVEELDRPGARIYELSQADMAVVMIVDASLDV